MEEICDLGRARGDFQVLGCGLLGGIRGFVALGRTEPTERLMEELAATMHDHPDGLELVHLVEGAALLAHAAFDRGDAREGSAWLGRAGRWLAEMNPAMKSRTLPALGGLFETAVAHSGDGASLALAQAALAKLRRFARVYPIGRPRADLCEAILSARFHRLRRSERAAGRALEAALSLEMPGEAAAALELISDLQEGPSVLHKRLRRQFERMLVTSSSPWHEALAAGSRYVRAIEPPRLKQPSG
jgi:hypothetical protein